MITRPLTDYAPLCAFCGYDESPDGICAECRIVHDHGHAAGVAEERARVIAFLHQEEANQREQLGAMADDIGIGACREAIEEGDHVAAPVVAPLEDDDVLF